VAVSGLGVPAMWITASASGTSPPDRPATTVSTALGTADGIEARLVLSPPGQLVIIKVSGQYSNSRMAEDLARLILDGI
jgi:hypothetical protein